MSAIVAEVILGFLTFTGSLMAAGKLQEVKWIPQRPVTYPGQNFVNIGVLVAAVALGVVVVMHPTAAWSAQAFYAIAGLAVLFGVLLIIPIGGADMPTVISILNSYAGLSAVAMGFVLDNKLLVTAGALDGSSGLILSIIMCRAMNRSFTNVLFGAFGTVQKTAAIGEQKAWKQETVEGAAQLLEQASLVVIIPGYGMAVAQAQHKVRELYDQLTKRGVTVKFAIHPVAGRMPGHMNVLLAEANIPYTALVEMEEINPDMPQCDVAGDRRQRRREPGRALRQGESHLRHADHRRRQGQDRARHQAQQEPRLCRHRQRAVRAGQHLDAVRRRQGGAERPRQAVRQRRSTLGARERFEQVCVIANHPLDRVALDRTASRRQREGRPALMITQQVLQQAAESGRVPGWCQHAGRTQSPAGASTPAAPRSSGVPPPPAASTGRPHASASINASANTSSGRVCTTHVAAL